VSAGRLGLFQGVAGLKRFVFVAVLMAACSDAAAPAEASVPCGAASTCPNDPPPSQYDTDMCHAEVGARCGAAVQAYLDCYADMRVCAFDGTTDVVATEQACAAESTAVAACGDAGTSG